MAKAGHKSGVKDSYSWSRTSPSAPSGDSGRPDAALGLGLPSDGIGCNSCLRIGLFLARPGIVRITTLSLSDKGREPGISRNKSVRVVINPEETPRESRKVAKSSRKCVKVSKSAKRRVLSLSDTFGDSGLPSVVFWPDLNPREEEFLVIHPAGLVRR